MIYRVTLLPDHIEFDADSKQTLLDAALESGINLPNRCRVGVCTACVCKKIEGVVYYDLEPVLTEKEQQQGWIFPCKAYPRSHLVLSLDE
ncbi:2Fe-2S iron-sulfur cluster-binding protein [Vibrio rumoiensis]|uniref:Ferredoxin n=1 Tax=Vibrio rumoiensis 1S-45 TaxID=1188252 RepID=A0A1E5E431_9VIBR|nr:2Fe-2S iron-sulfur cluster-binding protein [Vibrio rumoiensis]OEF27208.1 ferredoxin [Vibrio rumoiensis 1S-45]